MMKSKLLQYITFKNIWMLFIAILFIQCDENPQELPKSDDELVISEYIAVNKDFSMFNELLISTGLNNLLSIRGPYTLFLPNNAAMQAYYSEKGLNSYTDIDSIERRDLVYNHIVPQKYVTGDFQLGTLKEKNALGDNIVTEFQGADIIINKYSRIIKRDVKVSNGTIQIMDKVLEPITLSVYDVLAADPSYSIFTQGLERTGLKDTLQLISFIYGQHTARTSFTILAITDTTLNRYGIHSIDELINKYTDKPDSIRFHGNGFYDFMDYHCLDKEAYYYSSFAQAPTLYSVLSKNNNLQIKILNREVIINYNAADSSSTGIYIDQSDIPAKNGVFHTINNLMEVSTPSPTTIIWETTDYFDFKQGEYYLNHFAKFFDTAQFEGIRWEGEYLQYYLKTSNAPVQMNYDALNMLGFWKLEVTTPKIPKGKYSVNARIWQWNPLKFEAYIDGVLVNVINGTADAPTEPGSVSIDGTNLYKFGEVNWTTTTTHKLKVVALTSCPLWWDRMEFKPIN